ncbi:MAG: aminotransferase class I/II-fold pyridoxal phosphate-dependent enzyme [Patescibacteria group bacterium]|nr:aminotransferase class I/II-fold pyridoxal phosphate-dependent enzyme [Patescibacteria group bacterium]
MTEVKSTLSMATKSGPPAHFAYTMGDAPRRGDRRLHLNEFRYAHHPDVVAAARAAVADDAFLTEYTTGSPTTLVKAIAEFVGVGEERVAAGAGSDEVLRAVTLAFARRGGGAAIGAAPTYTHFIHFVAQAGLKWLPVHTGRDSDSGNRAALMELRADVLEAGALVYMDSPNNPTGACWERKDVETLAARYPTSTFLVDEAYTEFEGAASGATGPAAAVLNSRSLVLLTSKFDNVIVSRTFSKAFGLAAVRVGYAIGGEKAIALIAPFLSPKALTPVAVACAVACLGAADYYLQRSAEAVAQRRRLVRVLRARGWHAESGGGNFMLLYAGQGAIKAMRAAGIHVRDRSELPAMGGFVRITAGTPDDTAAVLHAIEKETPPSPPETSPRTLIVQLRQFLAATASILDKHRIRWWACDGTLLGARRHGGIIPWDNDIDLGYVFDGDTDPIAGLADAFRVAGLELRRNRTDAYWQVGRGLPENPTAPVHECIDLFPFHLDKEGGMYLNADPRFRWESKDGHDCNTRYSEDELFPLSTAPFYDATIPVPAKADQVLDRALGKEWRTTAVAKNGKFTITDFSPA